jgi:mannosyltransferase OCH1-like enzyme
MIPKIIHYCWFGPRELSALNKACIKSWQKLLPDYEIVLWNEDNAPDHPYVTFALKYKKYAFAADFVRFYALNKFGGIYLDTDMELIRPFDHILLNNIFFSAYEDHGNKFVSCGVIGSIAQNKIVSKMLEKYENNYSFINVPLLLTQVMEQTIIEDDSLINIFPSYFFYPYNPFDEQQDIKQLMYKNIKDETYAIHHWEYSWKPNLWEKVYNRLRKIFKL